MSEISVDARGLRCPWPALRLARALRQAPPGTIARILADDPAAPKEIDALAAERGWTAVAFREADGAGFRVST